MQELSGRFKVAIAAVIGITVAGLSITITTSINVDVDVTPPEVREGWAGPEAVEQAQEIVGAMPAFRIEGIKRDNERANVRLWTFAKEVNGGEHLPNVAQQVGDCVSWGAANAVNYLAAVQIARDFQHSEFHAAFPPYIYGTSRVQVGGGRLGGGDGSVGAWAAEAVRVYGVLAADYDGVPEYSGVLARKWGRRGPPDHFIDYAQQFPVKTVAKVRSADDVRDAICNGYPVTIASNWGGKMQPNVIDGRLVNKRAGRWNHQMCVIGYDGKTGKEPYWYILNSWGRNAHGTPPDDAPPGGFWVREDDIDYIVRQGDSFAFSGFEGFPAQELDFRIVGDNHED